MENRVKLTTVFLAVVAFFFICVLVMHSWLGTYSRLLCDEYMILDFFQVYGAAGFFQYYFSFITGRFSLIIVYAIFAAIGPEVLPVLTGVVLVAWVLVTTWTIHQLMQVFQYGRRAGLAFFLSLTLVFTTLSATPNIFQSLYWAPGMFTYVLPLLFMTWQIGLLAGFVRKGKSELRGQTVFFVRLVIIFILSVFAAGFSESQALMVLVALVIVLGLTKRKGENLGGKKWGKNGGMFLVASIGGTVVALGIHFFSPGNHIRKANFAGDNNLLSVGFHSLVSGIKFLYQTVLDYPLPLLIMLVSAFLIFTLYRCREGRAVLEVKRGRGLALIILVVSAVILVSAAMVPSFYAVSSEPPPRVMVLPVFFLIVLVGLGGSIMSRMIRIEERLDKKVMKGLVAVSFILFLLGGYASYQSLRGLQGLERHARHYAIDWDNRDMGIRSSLERGEKEYIAMPLKRYYLMLGLEEATPDPGFWVNRVIARYYGLDSFKIKKPHRRVRQKRKSRFLSPVHLQDQKERRLPG